MSGGVSNERAAWLARNVLRHEAALRAWLRAKRLVGLEIDDLVQETYAVLAGLKSVDHITDPRSYAFQVAQSLILQHVRRARVVSILNVAELDRLNIRAEEPLPDVQTSDREALFHLAAAIDALPPRCREAFTLRKIQELSYRDIAARMGVSESTVDKHLTKALGLLMQWFARDGGSGGAYVSSQSDVDGEADGQARH